ncbi:MAG: hypothetical protein M3P97_07020 [Actinomycetota bacterium]|jgi:hypothetical protein|nr:hypothetical protein [Actinomycetota bacterium]
MATDRRDDRGRCDGCAADLAHCHATMVVHADGVLACQEADACGARPELHDWWISCTELASPCGCAGDEDPATAADATGLLARAA